jgi:phosphate/sulfate permease
MKKASNNSDNKFAFIVCSIILVPIIAFIITMGLMSSDQENYDTDNYEEYYYMDIDESEILDLTQSDTTMFE